MERTREAGGSAAARSAGSVALLGNITWGLRPRLYAFVRFADSKIWSNGKAAGSKTCSIA